MFYVLSGIFLRCIKLDYFPMIAAGEGKNSGKMVCGQFGSFIPGSNLRY